MMRTALIGLGMVSNTYGDAIRNSKNVSLSYVHARSQESVESFRKQWSDLQAAPVDNVQQIADSDVDFVIIATPPNARADIVDVLAKAGKPILMEKPIERTLEKATALVDVCDSADIPLGIVLQHRARPEVNELRQVMPTLGALKTVEVNVPWWRPQSYYDEPGRGTYSRDGGGVLISQAIHTLDLMLSLTGAVAEVTAMAATTDFHQMEAEDFVTAGLRFSNGAVGQLFATTASFPGRGESITLHCQQGTVHLDAGLLQIYRPDGSTETIGQALSSGSGADPMAFTSDWHRFVIEDFADALKCQRPPLISGREALGVHQFIATLEQSARSGSRVKLKDI